MIVVMFNIGAFLEILILDCVFICGFHVVAVYELTEVSTRILASLQTTL